MKLPMNKSVFQILNSVLIAFLVVQIISLALFYYTKPFGIDSVVTSKKGFFELYTLSKALDTTYPPPAPKPSEVITKTVTEEVLRYDPYTLTAIISGHNKAFIMLQNGSQTELINKGSMFKHYKLVEIGKDNAVFEVYGKRSTLTVGKSGMLPRKESVTTTKSELKEISQKPLKGKTSKSYPHLYKSFLDGDKNSFDLWSDTHIIEIYTNTALKGFKFETLPENSLFSRIGLTSGDILVSINNTPLKSRGELMQMYQNIPQMQSLKISFLRKGKIKELEYEIRH